MKSKLKQLVVDQDLCVGCGICASQSHRMIDMKIDNHGFWKPEFVESINDELDNDLLQMCPFNPQPSSEVLTEDQIADIFLSEAEHFHDDIGKYKNLYAGYSVAHRNTSSSGGLATYVTEKILSNGIVDAVVAVTEGENNNHYEYRLINKIDDIGKSSQTKYFPVTMSEVLKEIENHPGKIAIVGVSCFIKGIRLLQNQKPHYQNKIPFVVAIICGGLKSSYYSDFLAYSAMDSVNKYIKPKFREKNFGSTASDYTYSCVNTADNELNKIRMKDLPDMWGTGMFKSPACDFCEDVAGELADISLGDAWIEPYRSDGRGNNVIITRSKIADEIIKNGKLNNELKVDLISTSEVIKSQRGSFNHRHNALAYRINVRTKKGLLTPPKRKRNLKRIGLFSRIVQYLRSLTRDKSIEIWSRKRDHRKFNKLMYPYLKLLAVATRIQHKFR